MKISPDSLPSDIDLLKQLLLETLADKDAEIAELKQSVQRLLEQFVRHNSSASGPAVNVVVKLSWTLLHFVSHTPLVSSLQD